MIMEMSSKTMALVALLFPETVKIVLWNNNNNNQRAACGSTANMGAPMTTQMDSNGSRNGQQKMFQRETFQYCQWQPPTPELSL